MKKLEKKLNFFSIFLQKEFSVAKFNFKLIIFMALKKGFSAAEFYFKLIIFMALKKEFSFHGLTKGVQCCRI